MVQAMNDSKVKLYPSENVIEDFYEALASKNEKKLKKVHIPKSDVFPASIYKATESRFFMDFNIL